MRQASFKTHLSANHITGGLTSMSKTKIMAWQGKEGDTEGRFAAKHPDGRGDVVLFGQPQQSVLRFS